MLRFLYRRRLKSDYPAGRRFQPRLEPLEVRMALSAADPSAQQQYTLELINRMRMFPAAELPLLLNSQDPEVIDSLNYWQPSRTVLEQQWAALQPAPPVAWNASLAVVAQNHTQLMFDRDDQQHQFPGEPPILERLEAAGYKDAVNFGENIYAYARGLFHSHAGFAIDWGHPRPPAGTGIQDPPGHRINLMDPEFMEVGIGVVEGSRQEVGPLLITQDFGRRFHPGHPFLLGTVFRDLDGDGFYSMGEGLSGVTVQVTGPGGSFQVQTMTAGGYQLQAPPGTYDVLFTGGGLPGSVTRMATIAADNVKVDLDTENAFSKFRFQSSSFSTSESAGQAVITVRREGLVDQEATVGYQAQSGTAVAGLDFAATAGTLTFAPGETSRTFAVPIINNDETEPTEALQLVLSNPSAGALLGVPATAILSIADDDLPRITASNPIVNEGQDAVFTVSLSAPWNATVAVQVETALGTAESAKDFTPLARRTLTFQPGQTAKQVVVPVINDRVDEDAETFRLLLLQPRNGRLAADPGGVATILEDAADPRPAVQIQSPSAKKEGDEGVTPISFLIRLVDARGRPLTSGREVTVNYQTRDAAAPLIAATAGVDYRAATGALTFAPGQTGKRLAVDVLGDVLDEPAREVFWLELTEAANATLPPGTQAKGTIKDDDAPPTLAINRIVIQPEGDAGNQTFFFTVTLSAASGRTVSVNFATADGAAKKGLDYTHAAGTLVFDPGVVTLMIGIEIHGDVLAEETETFFVQLLNPLNARLAAGASRGRGSILDDDL